MSSWKFRENSLDAIRLFAASQVAVLHTCEFMFEEQTHNLFFDLIRLFPGVPIFFFVSGYLISKSYESTPSIAEYAKNRALRLFPALVLCVGLNIALVWSTGYLATVGATAKDVALLFFAKVTFLQFYNPDFMRHFGDGVLNGSLWTICVELQFYVLTPIIYLLFGKDKRVGNTLLIGMIAVFLIANRLLYLWEPAQGSELVLWKLYRVSFIPWIYMFLVGMLCQRNFATISGWLSKWPVVPMVLGYVVVAYVLTQYAGIKTGNGVSPILFALVAPLILRLAYLLPERVNAVMKGNDISYGIYIWHMVIVNQMLYLGYHESPVEAAFAIAATVVIALLSWKLLEKPALRLKKFTLNVRLKKTA